MVHVEVLAIISIVLYYGHTIEIFGVILVGMKTYVPRSKIIWLTSKRTTICELKN
jgi:hypothetical protein